ncbi:MAG: hypothetical protein SFW66_10115 [Gammaproteobacteria bacterium]|nr:hypothetical protein [Gammaproteobacteria bacterium]
MIERILFSKQDRFFQHPVSFISDRGFLPGKDPLQQLPSLSVFNDQLNEIANNIPALLEKRLLRTTIDNLNEEYKQDTQVALEMSPQKKKQQHVAIVILLMLAQAYIWEDKDHPMNTLPPILSKNLYAFCRSQQRLPTITYRDYILRNWRRIDCEKPISLDNIKPLFTFTTSADEAWFIKIHVVIESICSQAMIAACKAHSLTHEMMKHPSNDPMMYEENEKKLVSLLNTISTSLEEAMSVLKRMTEQCQPDYFFFTLRHYLGGWEKIKSKDAAGIEQTGIQFADIETKDTVFHSYRGPSGAQSSIIPALDALLGVEQNIDGMYKTLLEFQEYMPKKHNALIGYLSTSKVREVVQTSHSPLLKEALDQAERRIKAFRGIHMGIVHNFIMKPAESIGIPSDQITGTGGAPIGEYLGERYANTCRH